MSLAGAIKGYSVQRRSDLAKVQKGKYGQAVAQGVGEIVSDVVDVAGKVGKGVTKNIEAWEDYEAGQEHLGLEIEDPAKGLKRWMTSPKESRQIGVSASEGRDYSAKDLMAMGSLLSDPSGLALIETSGKSLRDIYGTRMLAPDDYLTEHGTTSEVIGNKPNKKENDRTVIIDGREQTVVPKTDLSKEVKIEQDKWRNQQHNIDLGESDKGAQLDTDVKEGEGFTAYNKRLRGLGLDPKDFSHSEGGGSQQQFAKGGDFITTGPKMIQVGDNPGGRERVQVTPLSSPNINGPQGTGQDNTVVEDEIMDEMKKGDDDIISAQNKFYGKLEPVQIQNLKKAGQVGGTFAQKVMMRESSGGVNTGDSTRTGSMFQFEKGGEYMGLDIPPDTLGNPQKETEYFMKYNKKITKNFEKNDIYNKAKSHGLSKDATNYGAHQQGGAGIQDIITAADSGNLSGGNNRIAKMLNNVTPEQLKQLNSKYGKSLTHQLLKDSGEIKSFIQEWLSMQQESWDAMEGDFF